MRRPIAIAAAAALIAGGAAAAAAAGPFGLAGGERGEHRAELAAELAERLEGVSPRQVESALRDIESARRAERRAQLAAALAAELEGVDGERAEAALRAADESLRRARTSGERPRRGALVAALAEELDVAPAEVRAALHAAHRARMREHVEAAVAAGRIGEEDAERMLERAERRHGPGRHHRVVHPGWAPPMGP